MKIFKVLALTTPIVSALEPMLPSGYSYPEDPISTCRDKIPHEAEGNDKILQVVACSILNNEIGMGIIKPGGLPEGQVHAQKRAFNDSSIYEMINDGCFDLSIVWSFEERRAFYADSYEYRQALSKYYGVSVDTKGSYGFTVANAGYTRKDASVQTITGVHGFSQAEYQQRAVAGKLINRCMVETCDSNDKKCTKRYMTPQIYASVMRMVKDPRNLQLVETFTGMYGLFLPNAWWYGSANTTISRVEYTRTSRTSSSTVSNALSASVKSLNPMKSASISTQMNTTFNEAAGEDSSMMRLYFDNLITGPCTSVPYNAQDNSECKQATMDSNETWNVPMEVAGYVTLAESVATDIITLDLLTNTTFYALRTCATVGNGVLGMDVLVHPVLRQGQYQYMQCRYGHKDSSDTCEFNALGLDTNLLVLRGDIGATNPESNMLGATGHSTVYLRYLDGQEFGLLDRGKCHHDSSEVRAVDLHGDDNDHCGTKEWYWKTEKFKGSSILALCQDEKNCVMLKNNDEYTTIAHIYHDDKDDFDHDSHRWFPYKRTIFGVTKDEFGTTRECNPRDFN